MAEQASAREAELAIQRLTALGWLTETLFELAGVAWEESKNPPKPAPYRLPPTQLHVMNAQLRTSLALYTALGGQPVDGIDLLLADLDMYLGGEPTEKFVGLAKSALEGVARAADRDKHRIASSPRWNDFAELCRHNSAAGVSEVLTFRRADWASRRQTHRRHQTGIWYGYDTAVRDLPVHQGTAPTARRQKGVCVARR